MLTTLRALASKRLNILSLRKYRTSMGWRDAPRYDRFLRKAQQSCFDKLSPLGDAGQYVEQFRSFGATTIFTTDAERVANSIFNKIKKREQEGHKVWVKKTADALFDDTYNGNFWLDFPEFETIFHGPIGRFLEHHFKAHFKIFYCTLHRSVGINKERSGSQIWHNDGGPGTCVILGFFPHATDEYSGCTEFLPWNESLLLYEELNDRLPEFTSRYCSENKLDEKGISKEIIRIIRNSFYEDQINSRFGKKVIMPYGRAGLTSAFTNNLLHRGGYPTKLGVERYIVLVHCYPSMYPTPYERYREEGLPKTAGYPVRPDF